MPYRYAHHALTLVILPVIIFAFWPAYFGQLSTAPLAFHAHGITAMAWILLVAAQSWTIHSRRFALHRQLGRLMFVAVPLFVAGGAIAVQSMAFKYVTQSEPFYAALGPMLGLDDLISTTSLALLARAALANRKRPAVHGGYLLGTVLLVFPPIIARLGLPVPVTWHMGEVIPCAIAAVLAATAPKQSRPFLIVIAILVGKAVADTLFGFSGAWIMVFTASLKVPMPLIAAIPAGLSFLLLWTTWRKRGTRGEAVRARDADVAATLPEAKPLQSAAALPSPT